MKRICLFTATGTENLGDELITLCEIQEFLKNNPDIQITLFSHDIGRTKRFLLSQKLSLENITIKEYFPNNLKKKPLKNTVLFWETLKAIKKTDHIFIGGGGLFYARKEEWHSPMKLWWMRVFLAQILRKPLTYLSLGISISAPDLKDAAHMFFWNKTITVRDKESFDVVNELWYRSEILPDPALTYSPSWTNISSSKTIGIALRKGFLPDETVLQIIKKLLTGWYKVLLLPHSLHPTDESSHDGYYLQNFLLPGVETTQSIEQTLEGYKKCHIILAMRLHSIILAIDHHIPFFGISYGKKTDVLLWEIKWPYSLQSDRVFTENISEAIGNIESDYNNLEVILSEIHTDFQNIYHEKFSQVVWK